MRARALALALAVAATACGPPKPVTPPPITETSAVYLAAEGVAVDTLSGPCFLRVTVLTSMHDDTTVVAGARAFVSGPCLPEEWIVGARLVCEPGCGPATPLFGTIGITVYGRTDTQLALTRAPNYGHLRLHVWATIDGSTDNTTVASPMLRCDTPQALARGTCLFQIPSPN